MLQLLSTENKVESVSPSYYDLLVRALSDPHSYNPVSNGFIWFGFLWGIPIPVVTLWLQAKYRSLGIPRLIADEPIQLFFLAHPLLFGFLFGLVGSMVQHYIDRLKEESIGDYLTGLYNHRSFREELKRRVEEADRYDQTFCLVMLDIDHFKDINDQYGHQAGDDVLQQLGILFQETTREADIVSRYGGEEFAIILPETSRGEGLQLADRIRETVEGHDFDIPETVTVSGGVANYPDDGGADTDLIKVADEQLYQAKESGRNRIATNGHNEPTRR